MNFEENMEIIKDIKIDNGLSFKFTSKVARLLGRESVSSDTAALFELVKNAYDADATELIITFENLLENGGKNARITIKDNGEGMTYDDIEKKMDGDRYLRKRKKNDN